MRIKIYKEGFHFIVSAKCLCYVLYDSIHKKIHVLFMHNTRRDFHNYLTIILENSK